MCEIDWSEESAQQAINTIVAMREKWPVTEFQIAEMMMMAQTSFWYSIAQHDKAPGAVALVELIDGGYHKPTQTWWNVKATWPDLEVAAQKLTDLTIYLGTRQAIKNESLATGSFMWPTVARIILGKHASKLFMLALLSPDTVRAHWLAVLDGSTFVRPCIHPDCEVLVDRRVKKSGACCKAHMNYVCTHPDCVKKAAAQGWKHYTHPFGTKIATAHWEYREGNE